MKGPVSWPGSLRGFLELEVRASRDNLGLSFTTVVAVRREPDTLLPVSSSISSHSAGRGPFPEGIGVMSATSDLLLRKQQDGVVGGEVVIDY